MKTLLRLGIAATVTIILLPLFGLIFGPNGAIANASGNVAIQGPSSSSVTSSASTSTSPSVSASPLATTAQCAAQVHYYAASTDKKSKYAYGTAVPSTDRVRVLSAFENRFARDPAFAGSTAEFLDDGYDFDANTQSYIDDSNEWQQSCDSTLQKLRDAEYTTSSVPAGTWSLYMVKSGDTYTVRQGKTTKMSDVAVFTIDGTEYTFLTDYGLQPIRLGSKFPGVSYVPKDSISYPGDRSAASATPQSSSSSSSSASPNPSPSQTNAQDDSSKDDYVYPSSKPQATPDPVQHSQSSSSSSGTSAHSSGNGSASSSSSGENQSGGSVSGGDPGVPN